MFYIKEGMIYICCFTSTSDLIYRVKKFIKHLWILKLLMIDCKAKNNFTKDNNKIQIIEIKELY